MTAAQAAMYRRYLQACPPAPGRDPTWKEQADMSEAWDAMPLRLRVELCRRCHWLDAVYEACLPVGIAVNAVRRIFRRVLL